MLRLFFTTEDIVRTRVAATSDPLWETALSLTLLQSRKGAAVFDRWRQRARTHLSEVGPGRHILATLIPPLGYFPDFLTPREGIYGLDEGLSALLATSRHRLDAELTTLATQRRLPAWTDSLTAKPRNPQATGRGLAHLSRCRDQARGRIHPGAY